MPAVSWTVSRSSSQHSRSNSMSPVARGRRSVVRFVAASLALAVTAEGTIAGIEVQETEGALTRFWFTDEQANVPMAANTFRFKARAGVPVVDGLPPV